MAARIDREELRKLIREALREALGDEALVPPPSRTGEGDNAKHGGGGGHQRRIRHSPPPPPPAVPLPRPAGEEQSARRPSPSPNPFPQGGGGTALTFGSGVLTETKLVALAKAHSKIVVGNDVAITPLARDRARELKIEIVRQKP